MSDVHFEITVGPVDCEWWFYAYRFFKFQRVPCIGERLGNLPESDGCYVTVDDVSWPMSGHEDDIVPTVHANLNHGPDDRRAYFEYISRLRESYANAGWIIEDPEGVSWSWSDETPV